MRDGFRSRDARSPVTRNHGPQRRGESGQILIYVTLALVLAMLIIPPLLGFVFTAGRTAQIREDRMLHVHAADAGVEDGYFHVANTTAALPESPDDPPMEIEMGDINGYDVGVEIYKDAQDGVYKILSTATSESGVDVQIESYTSVWDYLALMDNALSSYGDIVLSPNTQVDGNVTLNGDLNNKGDIEGEVSYGGIPGWPPAEELSAFYWDDVKYVSPFPGSVIELTTDETRGPLYRDGNLLISSANNTATLTLEGTIYVTGDLAIGKTDKDFVLDLNDQTIYCEGSIDIGGKCILVGPGCMIAVGDVTFMPKLQGNDFIFIMAVEGTITAQPNGDFYGSMAGNIEIQYQPGTTLQWIDYEVELLNFPPGSALPRIVTYTILE